MQYWRVLPLLRERAAGRGDTIHRRILQPIQPPAESCKEQGGLDHGGSLLLRRSEQVHPAFRGACALPNDHEQRTHGKDKAVESEHHD